MSLDLVPQEIENRKFMSSFYVLYTYLYHTSLFSSLNLISCKHSLLELSTILKMVKNCPSTLNGKNDSYNDSNFVCVFSQNLLLYK